MTRNVSRTALAAGAASGVVAYLVGYLFTYALSASTVRDSGIAQFAEAFGDGGATWKMVGWVFYNAHGVTTTLDVDVPIVGGTSSVNFIAQSEAISVVLYVVPAALLVVAGLGAARLAGSTELDDAFRLGPAVALGYLPLAVVGAVLFTVTVGDAVGEPTLLTAVGLAGVVYPVAFGTLGAALGAAFAGGDVQRGTTA